MGINLRALSVKDADLLLALYRAVAVGGTLGRDSDEYTQVDVVQTLEKALTTGVCLGAFNSNDLCGEIHGSRLMPRRFRHVFSGLTVAVHPNYQRLGIGRSLFEALLAHVDALDPPIQRVELILQAGNSSALHLYTTLGFAEEGRLRQRVRCSDGSMVDDIYMARLRVTDLG
jgi:ribosomal protein S18 acetylase RimI-like enzyme